MSQTKARRVQWRVDMGMRIKPLAKRQNVLFVENTEPNTLYMTAQSTQHYAVRRLAVDEKNKLVQLEAWYPNIQMWSKVWVDYGYLVRTLRESETMKIKAGHAAAAAKRTEKVEVLKKTIGKTSQKSITETWGIAFEKHGKSKNPAKDIVAYLKSEYPDRKTNWAKWVNGMRQRYNRGLLGNTAPTEPIKPYK